MAKGIPLMGRGPDGKAKIINVDENGNVKVQLSGTIASDSGLHANRPQPNAVRPGFLYYSVDTKVLAYSNGTSWVVS